MVARFASAIAIAAACLLAPPAHAADRTMQNCLINAASKFQVPVTVIATIAMTERCHVGFVGKNHNGSVDRGLMCINSIHDDRLAHAGITPEQLRDDACTSIAVATMMLREHFDAARISTPRASAENHQQVTARWWADAIGRYHSKTPHFKARYQGLARSQLERLMSSAGK